MVFYPKFGFPVKGYFPYYNQPGYRSPVVFAQFKNAAPGTLIQVRNHGNRQKETAEEEGVSFANPSSGSWSLSVRATGAPSCS